MYDSFRGFPPRTARLCYVLVHLAGVSGIWVLWKGGKPIGAENPRNSWQRIGLAPKRRCFDPVLWWVVHGRFAQTWVVLSGRKCQQGGASVYILSPMPIKSLVALLQSVWLQTLSTYICSRFRVPPPTPPAMVMVITHQPPSPLWNGWVLGRGGGHPTRTNRNATGRIRWRKLVSSKTSMYVEISYKTVS